MYKYITGILTILPYILFVVAFKTIGDFESNTFMYCGIGIHGISLILLITFGLHVFRSNVVDKEKRKLWMAVLFFGNIMVFPVYWYIYVFKKPNINT